MPQQTAREGAKAASAAADAHVRTLSNRAPSLSSTAPPEPASRPEGTTESCTPRLSRAEHAHAAERAGLAARGAEARGRARARAPHRRRQPPPAARSSSMATASNAHAHPAALAPPGRQAVTPRAAVHAARRAATQQSHCVARKQRALWQSGTQAVAAPRRARATRPAAHAAHSLTLGLATRRRLACRWRASDPPRWTTCSRCRRPTCGACRRTTRCAPRAIVGAPGAASGARGGGQARTGAPRGGAHACGAVGEARWEARGRAPCGLRGGCRSAREPIPRV